LAAIFLSVFKLIIGLLTGSLGILSEALHSILDLFAAVINYFSVRVSDKPADIDHHFTAKKYNSQALEADALHFSSDIWSSAVVLLGLICANFGYFFAGPVAALFVAIIILYVTY